MAFYANPDPTYQPAMRLVTNITKSINAVVTTSFDHDYVTGTIVRLYVPHYFGMFQIDKLYGDITVLTPDTFSININSINYDSFLAPGSPEFKKETALCIPIGNLNSIYGAEVVNVT